MKKEALRLTMVTLVAIAASGCLAKIDTTTSLPDGGAEGGEPGGEPGGGPGAGGGAAPGCWQASKDAPAATGPSGQVGSCSLVGTWDYDLTFSGPKQPKQVWSFDDEGRAVGGPAGTNLCAGFPWSGNYKLSASGFEAINIRGKGAPSCSASGKTTFTVAFSEDCKKMTLPRILTDSCTGGALFYTGTMVRRD